MPSEMWWGTEQSAAGARPYVNTPETVGSAEGRTQSPQVSGVRPYLITDGRAQPVDVTLRIEAQVLTTSDGAASLGRLAYERRDIVRLCHEPQSVAELAANLSMHLGVARVLVGDLVAAGLLVVRHPEGGRHRVQIIERVIRGLQSIS